MKHIASFQLDVRIAPSLGKAISQWLDARDSFKIQPSDVSQREYEATLNNLGVVWGELYPEGADTPGAFEWYRRGLIAPDAD
jgi:hypothetical protein